MSDRDAETAVADIWRFEDGLIVEHWDVVQPLPVRVQNRRTAPSSG
jgi:predicted SnoaL-like aldol condensation-catalyzing enzyme